MNPDMSQAPSDGPDHDEQTMMDHVATECMQAIEHGDKEVFMDCMKVLIHHAVNEMNEPEHQGE